MKLFKCAAAAAMMALGLMAVPTTASADEPYVGEIRIFPYTYCPRDWAPLNGQLIAISDNAQLYSLIGNTFGGNGQSNFALPNMQGRSPMHEGQGPGLTPRIQGQAFGSESQILTEAQLPSHTHEMMATTSGPVTNNPAGSSFATYPSSTPAYSDGIPSVDMKQGTIADTGSNQDFGIIQPTLVLQYCIALDGLYPPRN